MLNGERNGQPPTIEIVTADDQLTLCRRLHGNWSRHNTLRPFLRPDTVRVHHVAPISLIAGNGGPESAVGRGQRLLIVDDKSLYRDRLRDCFGQFGYELFVVATAAEALALIETWGLDFFAVVVSDVSMEYELSGLYLAWQLHRRRFRGRTILASTGFDNYFAVLIAQWILPLHGVDWLMPKRPLKRRQRVRFIRCRGIW